MTARVAQVIRIPMQTCTRCGHVETIERTVCEKCLNEGFDRSEVDATGSLASWTTIRRAPTQFRDQVPYVVCIVDLSAGYRVTGRLVTDQDPEVGMAVMATEIRNETPIFAVRAHEASR